MQSKCCRIGQRLRVMEVSSAVKRVKRVRKRAQRRALEMRRVQIARGKYQVCREDDIVVLKHKMQVKCKHHLYITQ